MGIPHIARWGHHSKLLSTKIYNFIKILKILKIK